MKSSWRACNHLQRHIPSLQDPPGYLEEHGVLPLLLFFLNLRACGAWWRKPYEVVTIVVVVVVVTP